MKTEQALASARRRPNKKPMQTKKLQENVPRRERRRSSKKKDNKQPKKETDTQRAGPLCCLRPPSLVLDSCAEDTGGIAGCRAICRPRVNCSQSTLQNLCGRGCLPGSGRRVEARGRCCPLLSHIRKTRQSSPHEGELGPSPLLECILCLLSAAWGKGLPQQARKKRLVDAVVHDTCRLRYKSYRCVFQAHGRRHCVRAAKELDSKSNGLCPQGLESPRCRIQWL